MWGQRNPRKVTRPYLSEALFHIPSWDCSLASLKTASSYPILLWGGGGGRQKDWGAAVAFRSLNLLKPAGSLVITGPITELIKSLAPEGCWHFYSAPKVEGLSPDAFLISLP